MNPFKPADTWSVSSSAVYGWLTGIAVGGRHLVHFARSHDIPDNEFVRVVSVLMAAGCSGAVLFAGIAALRNQRARHFAIAMTSLGPQPAIKTTSTRAVDGERQRVGAEAGFQPKRSTFSE